MLPVVELRSVIPAAVQAATRRVEPLLAVLRIDEQTGRELLQRYPTRVFDGHVLESKANGDALIEIDGQTYRAQLSMPRAAGEQVIAKWVERLPVMPPSPGIGDATVRLGGEAKVLSAFAAAAEQETTPLKLITHASAAGSAVQLAQELSRAITNSGVFYESHLRRWAAGSFAAKDLLREPQARLPDILVRQDASPAAATALAQDTAPLPVRANGALEATFREQFRAIEHGETRFELTPWPGQVAQLTLFDPYRNGQQQHASQDAPVQASEAALSLELPGMGRLDLRLRLHATSVWLHAKASEEDSIRHLRDATSVLSTALATAGLTLVATEVSLHDD